MLLRVAREFGGGGGGSGAGAQDGGAVPCAIVQVGSGSKKHHLPCTAS